MKQATNTKRYKMTEKEIATEYSATEFMAELPSYIHKSVELQIKIAQHNISHGFRINSEAHLGTTTGEGGFWLDVDFSRPESTKYERYEIGLLAEAYNSAFYFLTLETSIIRNPTQLSNNGKPKRANILLMYIETKDGVYVGSGEIRKVHNKKKELILTNRIKRHNGNLANVYGRVVHNQLMSLD